MADSAGSNPAVRTTFVRVAQPAEASRSRREQCGFESRPGHHHAVALHRAARKRPVLLRPNQAPVVNVPTAAYSRRGEIIIRMRWNL